MEVIVNREEKRQLAIELENKLQQVQAVIFTDYRGLDVEQITQLRNELRQVGVEYKVVKNTLVSRAISGVEGDEEVLKQMLVGPTAVAFSADEPVSTAKIIKNFAKDNDSLKIKGGLLDKKILAKEGVIQLASLPGKTELLAMLLAGMQSPITGLVRTLNGVIQKFVLTLDAVRQQKT